MTETDISDKIKAALQKQINVPRPYIHYDYMRLESHLTLQGLPDANLCVAGDRQVGITALNEPIYMPYPLEIWLEYKVGNNNPSPLQIAWAKRRFDLGQTNVYCVRGFSEATNLVSFTSMSQFWNEWKDNEQFNYDELVYRLLTGEFYAQRHNTA